MPRHHKRKLGARRYGDYTPETLNRVLQLLKDGKISQRKAESEFGIPRRTLNYKLKNQHNASPGYPRVLNDDEETAIINHAIAMSDFGFPIDLLDLRCITKDYLDRKGRICTRFKENLPGKKLFQCGRTF